MVTVGVLLLVLLIALLVVPRFFPTDKLTEQIVREVSRATGADVTLDKAELSWRGSWRLVLREGQITGTGGGLAAATGSANELDTYAAHIGELVVVPALMPLLRKQLEVREISLAGESLAVTWEGGAAEISGYRVRLTDLNLGLEQAGAGAAPGQRIPPDLAFLFAAVADTVILQEVPYTELDLEGRLAGRVVEVSRWEARRSTGSLGGKLTADYNEDPWGRLVFEVEGEDIPAAALLVPWIPEVAIRLDSDLSLGAVGRCDLRDKATRMRTLDVAGTVSGSEGVLRATDWLHEVSGYLGNRQDLTTVGFKALAHEFRFVQGRYMLQGLTLKGGETEWQGQGWVVPQGNLAIALDVKLPAGFTPDLGGLSFLAQSLRDTEGRINLPLTLSGRADKPVVGVDLGRLRTP
jgi:hypothetical protein